MAGDFIKWQKGLTKKPEVYRMAAALKKSRREIASALMELWEWADENVTILSQENVTHVTETSPDENGIVTVGKNPLSVIDSIIGIDGFAKAIVAVEWLAVKGESLEFPKFGRHNGFHAKKRMSDAERQRKSRANKAVTKTSQKTVTREEKRREENIYTLSLADGEFEFPQRWQVPSLVRALKDWTSHIVSQGKKFQRMHLESLLVSHASAGWSAEKLERGIRLSLSKSTQTTIIDPDEYTKPSIATSNARPSKREAVPMLKVTDGSDK